MKSFCGLVLIVTMAGVAAAHDTWVETNVNLLRSGDAIYIDLKLGNHGNEHRDFKLASKVDLDACTFDLFEPGKPARSLKDELVDLGYSPKEGFWQAKYSPLKPGLYLVAHTMDKVVSHGRTVRSIKSGKTFFVVSPLLDKVSRDYGGFDRVLSHPLEIVLHSHPVTPMGPGEKIEVEVLLRGKPLVDARVSFIPRGETLKAGFDATYERKTNSLGRASFTPKLGNVFLIAVHHKAPDEKGAGFEGTEYAATLTIRVPDQCPCCE